MATIDPEMLSVIVAGVKEALSDELKKLDKLDTIQTTTASTNKSVESLTSEIGKVRQDLEEKTRTDKAAFKLIDKRITALENVDFDPPKTLVFTNLIKAGDDISDKDVPDRVRQLFRESDLADVEPKITNVKRQGARNGRAGIVKVELDSEQSRVGVLRNKGKIKSAFEDVKVRGSQSHVERVLHKNMWTLLNLIPALKDQVYVSANGLIRYKNKDELAPKGLFPLIPGPSFSNAVRGQFPRNERGGGRGGHSGSGTKHARSDSSKPEGTRIPPVHPTPNFVKPLMPDAAAEDAFE